MSKPAAAKRAMGRSALRLSSLQASLADLPLGTLPAPMASALASVGRHRKLLKEETLHWAGRPVQRVHLVIEGRLRLRQFDYGGHERILGWVQPGMVAALAPLLAAQPFDLDVVADARSEVVQVERGPLLELMRTDAVASQAIAVAVSERMCRLVEAYMTQAYDSLAERVWACLQRLGRRAAPQAQGEDGVRELSITQAALAGTVGASRYRVGLELQRLAARGDIVLTRGSIRLLPRARQPRIG